MASIRVILCKSNKKADGTFPIAEAPPYRYSLDEENGLAVRCVKPFVFK